MSDSIYPAPLNRRLKRLVDGLTYQAVKSGNSWVLPLGTDAAIGEYITVDGVLGQATAAIVGGTDAIVENTNWAPEGAEGALNSSRFIDISDLYEVKLGRGGSFQYCSFRALYDKETGVVQYRIMAKGTLPNVTIQIFLPTGYYSEYTGELGSVGTAYTSGYISANIRTTTESLLEVCYSQNVQASSICVIGAYKVKASSS